jgi:hypothetical protein
MIFSVLLIIFALLAIFKTYKQYRKSRISLHWSILWTLIWLLLITVALMPNLTTIIANAVGIGRGADLIIYSTIIILLYGFYNLITTQDLQRRELTELTRKIAIENAKKPKI